MRKILFRHGRAPGDVLMFTAGVRDFKLLFPQISLNVETKFPELWENNPHLDRSINRRTEGVEVYDVGYPTIQGCNDGWFPFCGAFLFDMISRSDAGKRLGMSLGEFCSTFASGGDANLKKGDNAIEPFVKWGKKYSEFTAPPPHYGGKPNGRGYARQHGDLWLSPEEMAYNPIRDHYGAEVYWIVAPGGKRDCTCKIWDWRRFQKVVDHFDGLIKFVVIGRSDHLLEIPRGAINYVDKTRESLRGLIPLMYHAHGCVSGVSFPMHLAAATPPNPAYSVRGMRPCVAIYGGREPTGFTGYTGHQILHTGGALDCCDRGGCWQSRVTEHAKDPDHNKRLCSHTVVDDGRTIQQCMSMITADDVIRAIEKYYEGNIYRYSKGATVSSERKPEIRTADAKPGAPRRQLNMLASLSSRGGGEQSALHIASLLRSAGWEVSLYPWASVHDKWGALRGSTRLYEDHSFHSGAMLEHMEAGIPLLFYANDQIWDFCKEEKTGQLIEKSSEVVVGVNFCNGTLPRASWLERTGKVRGVVFQNREKLEEFRRDAIGYRDTGLVSLYGAIDLDRFYQLKQSRREGDDPLVILKHCTPDYRKYVTTKSENNGEKIHVWQKDTIKENDVKFYARFLNDCKFPIRFEFMEAHDELVQAYKDNPAFVFHVWDSMDVGEFLQRGHIYLYRTSNLWRDQYPRCVAEALAAGLPVLSEPRDGTADRVVHGDTGFYCVDYDQFLEAVRKLHRKEGYRYHMGYEAKEWAKRNLDPRRWVSVLQGLLSI